MNHITADSYFHIGAQHVRSGLPCEDYALAESGDDGAYAIVSDGCSSGGKTDVGARILAHALAHAIREEEWQNHEEIDDEYRQAVHMRAELVLEAGRNLLALDTGDMLATNLTAMISPRGGFVHIEGDGVIVRVYESADMVLSRFEWNDNMPYYPAYKKSTRARFIEAHGGNLHATRLTEERVTISRESCVTEYIPYSLEAGIKGVYTAFSREEVARLTKVAVFSDGVTQIEGVSWIEAVRKFLAFRSVTGAFVKRRMIRQLKEYARDGMQAIDDIAGAVIVQVNERHKTEEYIS